MRNVKPAELSTKVIRCNEWLRRVQTTPHKVTVNLSKSLARVYCSWTTRRCLNRLRTGFTCSKEQRQKWGYFEGDATCECCPLQIIKTLTATGWGKRKQFSHGVFPQTSRSLNNRHKTNTLAHLRTNKSPFFRSYLHKVNTKSQPSPLCPLCNTQTHDRHNLFNFIYICTTLSPMDSWADPLE